jgi:hypothetical protein
MRVKRVTMRMQGDPEHAIYIHVYVTFLIHDKENGTQCETVQ